jgi:hypothetical protein
MLGSFLGYADTKAVFCFRPMRPSAAIGTHLLQQWTVAFATIERPVRASQSVDPPAR